MEKSTRQNFEWKFFLLMSTVTFFAILSELAPTGVLSIMSSDLGVSVAQGGNLVGHYALASAIFGIPIVSASVTLDRKKLLLVIMAGFGLFNIIVGLSTNYTLTYVARFLSGICAGVLWPMIVAYGIKIAPEGLSGKAVAVIMAGITVGMSIGLPVFTTIANTFGWRMEFILLGALIIVDMFMIARILPSIPGEQRTKSNSPFTIIQNRGVIAIILITLFVITAHYGVYVYIETMVNNFQLTGGIGIAQLSFGIGSLLSVVLVTRLIDNHLFKLTVGLFLLGVLSLVSFRMFGGQTGIAHLTFLAWGMSFSSITTLLQAAVTKQVAQGKDVATSLQSAVFNFSIMIGTQVGGSILSRSGHINPVLFMGIGFLIVGTVVTMFSRKIIEREPAEMTADPSNRRSA